MRLPPKVLGIPLLSTLVLFVPNAVCAQQLTHTCKFDNGPRAGTKIAFYTNQPTRVGSFCTDGVASTGVAVPDDPHPQYTHTCKFDQGPRTGQTQAFRESMPVGGSCWDGVSSSGVSIADNTSGTEPAKPPGPDSASVAQQEQKPPAQQSDAPAPSARRGVVVAEGNKAKIASELKGHYFALVIGINNYQHLPKLSTAVSDAQALAKLLQDQYGFQTTVLVDATRDQITKAMNDYRYNLDENASLLIYYAGHGIYDKEADKAYWLPVDADRVDNSHWIMADNITTGVKVIPARHVLIISDSCYSGGMTREIAQSYSRQERNRFLEKMALGKSRTLMSSGALEPVSDTGGGGHSAFSGALLSALTSTSDSVFSAGSVFNEYIQVAVAGRSEQTPQYVPVRNSGHDYGDFVFVRSGKTPGPSAAVKNPATLPAISQVSPPEPPRQADAQSRLADNPNRALFQSLVGEYDFGAMVVTVALNGDGVLIYLLPGNPLFELEPAGDLKFNVKGFPGSFVEFHRDTNGAVTELVDRAPAPRATFTGQRRSGEKIDGSVLKLLPGEYNAGAFTVTVALRTDGVLTWFVPGQPLYELRFVRGLYFMIVELTGFSIEFRREGNGRVIGAIAHQPNGDFFVQRKK